MSLSNKNSLILAKNKECIDIFSQVLSNLNCNNIFLSKTTENAIKQLSELDFYLILIDGDILDNEDNITNIFDLFKEKNIYQSIIIYAKKPSGFHSELLLYSNKSFSIDIVENNQTYESYDLYVLQDIIKKSIKALNCKHVDEIIIPEMQNKLLKLEERNVLNEIHDIFIESLKTNKEKFILATTGIILLLYSIIEGYLVKLKNILLG